MVIFVINLVAAETMILVLSLVVRKRRRRRYLGDLQVRKKIFARTLLTNTKLISYFIQF